MSANSKIEWTDHTFNPWIGCTKVSPGCAHCYAEQRDKRHLIEPVDHWGKGAPRLRTSASNWRQPLKWNSSVAAASGRRPKVFCASLADIFDDEVQIEWLADLLALIHATPNLDWLLLTKRPENFRPRLRDAFSETPGQSYERWCFIGDWLDGVAVPENVWIGTSVEDQKRADERIPHLLQIPSAVRFLSCEPLLGPVDLNHVRERLGEQSFQVTSAIDHSVNNQHGEIDWVIVGGESGPNARPMHPDWARSLRDQCVAAGVPFFFKQWGEYLSEHVIKDALEEGIDEGAHRLFQHPFVTVGNENFFRVGKKEAGRGLDGQEWSQFPNHSEIRVPQSAVLP